MKNEDRVTFSGTQLKSIFNPSDIRDQNYRKDLNFPGNFPYTRGIEPKTYREKPWVIHTYMGFGSAEQTNQRVKYLLNLTKNARDVGISIALDLPTQVGIDPDNPLAIGEVGKIGVSLPSLRDFGILTEGVPLNEVGYINTVGSSIAPTFIAWCVCAAKLRGINPADMRVNVQNDVLKEYTARGTYIMPPEHGLKHSCDAIEYCSKKYPHWIPIAVSGYHLREAGAMTAANELGLAVSNAIAYIDALRERGLSIDKIAPSMRIFMGAGIDFLEEAAKFRATRRLWARLIRERYGSRNPQSLGLRIQCFTHGMNLTAQQPLNNIARVTIQALGAILGGVQYLHTSSYDEAHSIPTEESLRVAIRTQQIILHETSVPSVADPLGGSYYIEWLTNEIEEGAWKIVDHVDSLGGAVRAMEKGYYHRLIAEEGYRHYQKILNKEKIIVGMNEYKIDEEPAFKIFRPDPEVERRQVKRVKRIRAERDKTKIQESLGRLRRSAERGKNVIPAICDVVKADGTIGEIYQVFRDMYGEYRAPNVY